MLWDINLVPYNVQITNYFALNRLSQVSNMVLSPSSILGYRQNVVYFTTSQFKEYLNLNPKLLDEGIEAHTKQDTPLNGFSNTFGPINNMDTIAATRNPNFVQNDGNMSTDSSGDSNDEARNEIDYIPVSRNTKFRF